MLNKMIIVIVFIGFAVPAALSQKLVFRAEVSRGTFNMNDLKVLQSSNNPYLGVDVASVSSFPSYWGYGISMMSFLKSGFGFGITSEFFSTGARNYYADYSGTYNYDLLTQCVNLGIISSLKIKLGEKHAVILDVSQGIKLSSLNEEERLVINTPLYDSLNVYQSSSYWLKPVVRYDYSITRTISAGVYFGGEFNPQSSLYLKDDPEVFLTDQNQHKITINWSGIRFGLHLSINFLKYYSSQ